jgi:hypothetical protein
MVRMILVVVVLLLALVAGIAVALNHYFGWKGLIAFPFILIALVWLGKVIIGRLIKRFALGLFGMKSGVLRGATMAVHSVTAVAKPEPTPEPEEDTSEEDRIDADEEEDAEPAADVTESEPKHYFAVDVTITPKGNGEHYWEPGEFILTSERLSSLEDLEDGEKQVGDMERVEIWDGAVFGPDDPGKYPGPQRLRLTFAVKPGTSRAWLQYYAEPIGELELPRNGG